jgi:hypothetical protein
VAVEAGQEMAEMAEAGQESAESVELAEPGQV